MSNTQIIGLVAVVLYVAAAGILLFISARRLITTKTDVVGKPYKKTRRYHG